MAIDERARHELYLRLEEHLGAEAAGTLMEHLPPTGWSEVAMRRDLEDLRAATRADLEHFRAATKADIDHVAEVTRLEIERLGGQLRGEIHKALTEQTRTVVLTAVLANSGAVIAVAGLAFAAAKLT
jgi:hypothetical protein